jgi:hypothetical protein
MQNLYHYILIFLVVKLVLVLFFAVFIYREQRKEEKAPPVTNLPAPGERFYLLKSSLKRMNEQFHVGQIVFCNKKDLVLPAQRESPRQFREDQD